MLGLERGKRVLIVDDEVMIAFEMADAVEELGFEVVGPSVYLDEAENLARYDEIDLALLDINLGMGETSESVAKILQQRNIPFVFVTAYDASQIHFIDPSMMTIQKPITADMLSATLMG